MSFQEQDSTDALRKTAIKKTFVWRKKIDKLRKQGLTKQQIVERDMIQRQEDAEVCNNYLLDGSLFNPFL